MGLLDAPALDRIARRLGPLPVADRAAPANLATNGLSDGILLTNTYRIRHTALCSFYAPQLVFTNAYNNGGIETVGPNAITVNASIEPTSGTLFQVTFGGAASVTIPPGGMAVSDPVGIEILTGVTFFTRTHVSVASGKWPLGLSTSGTRAGEGNTSVTAGADWTNTTWNSGGTEVANTAYHPSAVRGIPATLGRRVIAVVGDSIVGGVGEASPNQDYGFVARALFGTGLSLWQQLSLTSSGVSTWSSPSSATRKGLIVPASTDAIVESGINALASLATLAAVQTSLTALWNELGRRGLQVWQTTITPSTTSTDAWATLGNQTVKAFEATRTALNDWIRTSPAPLAGYFEIADLAESARNSGKWRIDLGTPTTDGVHPSTVIHTAMAAGIVGF